MSRNLLNRALLARAVGGTPSLPPVVLVRCGAMAGVVAGLAEATYLGIRQAVSTQPAGGFYPELFWTAPASSGVAMLVVVGTLVSIAKVSGTDISAWKAALLLSFVPVYSVLQSDGIPLHPVAEILLSVGVATVVARTSAARVNALIRVSDVAGRALAIGAAAAVLLGVLTSPWFVEQRGIRRMGQPREGLPNILLIIFDTVRARNLGMYGYTRQTTPRLEEWARSGTVFERAIATAPWTLPSHSTMFTGRYNHELRTGSRRPLDSRFPTLAEVLRENGYATGGFVANHFYTTRMSGLQRGFSRYEEIDVDFARALAGSWLSRSVLMPLYRRVDPQPPHVKLSHEVTQEFLDWQRRSGDRPWFAFLNYFDAHSPYEPPLPWAETYGPRPDESWYAFEDRWRAGASSADGAQAWLNMYDGAITYMDHEFGVLIDSLEARGSLDNTIVIVTSDHGEMWGERNLYGHANTVYDPVLHVPLVISAPGRLTSGSRVRTLVTLRDLPATVLDLAGLLAGSPFPGAPFSHDPTESSSAVLAHVSPDPRDSYGGPFKRGEMRALYRGDLHYIQEIDGEEELYDWAKDPAESVDLSANPEYQDVLGRFRASADSIWSDS